jgi:hypothetical protein
MKSMFGKIVLSVAGVGAMIAATTPAEAQRGRGGYYHGGGGYHGGYHGYRGGYYRGGRTGLAVGAGLIGLGVGAAIASSNRGYYGGPAYYGGYYAPGYYAPGYYAPGPYYGYAPRCWPERQWDGYGWRRVRVCD